MLSLSNAVSGNEYTVKWMFGVKDVMDFLHDRQIKQGSKIQVVSNTGSGMIIRSGRNRIAISQNVADRIKV